jgi:ribonuclease P protein component
MQFNAVFKESKKFVTPEFLFLVRPNDANRARLGLSLSKRYIAKAATRNRLKRVFRDSFRQQQLPHIDIVALARTGLANKSNKVLFTRLVKTWQKINAYYIG